MTQRGRTHWTNLGHELQSIYELTARGSKHRYSAEEFGEEEDPRPHVSFSQENGHDGGNDIGDTDETAAPGFI